MNKKISYHSTPPGLDLNNDFEVNIRKAEERNHKIRSLYFDRIEKSEHEISSLNKRVFKKSASPVESKLLLAELMELRAKYLRYSNQQIDLGCEIDEADNFIQKTFDQMVSHIQKNLLVLDGYIDLTKQRIENGSLLANQIDVNRCFDLKSQFKDNAKYNEVVERLIQAGHIIKHGEILTFIPKRKSTKYEVEALRQTLQILGYLKPSDFSNSEILTLLSNTFSGYKAVDRILRSASIPESIKYYRRILS